MLFGLKCVHKLKIHFNYGQWSLKLRYEVTENEFDEKDQVELKKGLTGRDTEALDLNGRKRM